MEKEQNLIDLLLCIEPARPQEKSVKIKRLSELCGADMLFKLRAMSYDRVVELKETARGDMSVDIILAGVISPDLKDGRLLQKYKAATPAELVKTMLLPGEIENIAREIEKLSGYRTATLEEIKKK